MDGIDRTAAAMSRVRFQVSPLGMLTALLRLAALPMADRAPGSGTVDP